jgi:hypothetical protein
MNDFEQLRELEESLWRAVTRFDREYVEQVLAEDFFEFGRSGRVYRREEILAMPRQEIRAQLPLQDFTVHRLSDEVALVTYRSEVTYQEVEISNRSSIWSRTPTGWKLRFHQGTPVPQG